MKRTLILAGILALGLSVGLLAQDAAKEKKVDVTGTWELTIESPQGTMTASATYKQEGEKLTGTQTGPMGEDKLEGTVKDGTINYVIHISPNGQDFTITFTGKVDGDKIAGSFDFNGMGSANWSAARKK
jgi:hypothetical protein